MRPLGHAGPINSGTAAGSAGSATNNNTHPTKIDGEVIGAYVRYNDSPPATTDVTIATAGAYSVPAYNLLVLTNVNTSGYYPIAHAAYNAAGGASLSNLPPAIMDKVIVTIAGADAGDSVDVWLFVR